jgi:hypothetical protein
MSKLARRQEQQQRADKFAKALEDSLRQIATGLEQLLVASENEGPIEKAKMRARHTIEEARLNYDKAFEEIRRLQDEERNDRLEAIARSNKYATWATALVAVAAFVLSLVALLK